MVHRQVLLLLGSAFALGVLSGCGSPARSTDLVEPAEHPLPPASGTPIGILIDESAALTLRPEQLDELREIDRSLATRNDEIEMELRSLTPKQAAAPRGKPGGPVKRKKKDEVGGTHRRIVHAPGTKGSLLEERDENIREAIQEALDALDPEQRATAEKLLVERGAYATTSTSKGSKN